MWLLLIQCSLYDFYIFYHTTTKTTQQRKQSEMLGIILHSNFPTTKTLIDEQKVSDLSPLYTLAIVTIRHVM